MIEKSSARRVGWAAVAGVTVVATALTLGGAAGLRPGGLNERYTHAQRAVAELAQNKNAISRAGAIGESPSDPTTAAERAANASYVERERGLPDPPADDHPCHAPAAGRPGGPLRDGQRLLHARR